MPFERIDNGMIPHDGDFGGEPEYCEDCCQSMDDCKRCEKCGECVMVACMCVDEEDDGE